MTKLPKRLMEHPEEPLGTVVHPQRPLEPHKGRKTSSVTSRASSVVTNPLKGLVEYTKESKTK